MAAMAAAMVALRRQVNASLLILFSNDIFNYCFVALASHYNAAIAGSPLY